MLNKRVLLASLVISSMVCRGVAGNIKKYFYSVRQVPFTSVKISQNSFWGSRIKAVRDVTIPLAFSKCKTEGRYDNFVKAAHPNDSYDVSSFMGFSFDDGDVYKRQQMYIKPLKGPVMCFRLSRIKNLWNI